MENNTKYQEQTYRELYYGGSVGGLLKKCHQKLENYNFNEHNTILDIGIGFVPHKDYLKKSFKTYYGIDIKSALNAEEFIKKNYPDIIFKYYDGKKLPFDDETIDRIIISHVLEHILEPEKFLYEMMRVLKKGGIVSIALPCDPGLLYRFGRNIFKKTVLKKHPDPDYDHDYFAACEHVNSIWNLYYIIRKRFNVVKEICYPINIINFDLNLFYVLQIKK
tara:strand:+ start:188 stop:847 length:660 start_codon:yes stop_codon:yes gene_type:complete